MILTIDVGNSNIVLGGYENGSICFTSRLSTDRRMEADQYAVELAGVLELYGVSSAKIEGIALSSVVHRVTHVLLKALQHFSAKPPLVLSLEHAQDIIIDIENPRELGSDILAGALSVRHTRPLPAVIIDMGTATKFSALDENLRLRGVAIAPGLFVSLDALVQGASALSGIPLEAPPAPIGRNTQQSMQSGVVLGSAAMLDGMIDRFEEQLGTPLQTIIATGGAAPLIIPCCRHKLEYSETLLLDGLFRAYTQQNHA